MASTSRLNLGAEAAELDSDFDEEEDEQVRERRRLRRKRRDLAGAQDSAAAAVRVKKEPRPHRQQFGEERAADEGRRRRYQFLSLSAYDRHKQLVNEYLLYYRGATDRLNRDTSRDRTDLDVVRENHRFLWENGDEEELTWGQRLAKKYCQKLFKEYCICDLSRYKENKVAMRWRTEAEVAAGKGQFSCGARKCEEREGLRTWEVNFAYLEGGEKKNALVKVRLCPECSYRLNYGHKRKEVRRRKAAKKEKKRKKKSRQDEDEDSSSTDEETREKAKWQRERREEERMEKEAKDIWSKPVEVEQERTREEDFSEFLEDLFM